jgi:hypothetical protein
LAAYLDGCFAFAARARRAIALATIRCSGQERVRGCSRCGLRYGLRVGKRILRAARAGATLGGMAAVVAASTALATTTPTETGLCGRTKVRPALISLAVDGDAFLAGYDAPGHLPYSGNAHIPPLDWTKWTKTDARARGWEWIDNDHPSVGQGTYYAFRATVHLYRPRAGVFTRMTIVAQIPRSFIRRWHGGWSRRETLSAAGCTNSGGMGWD